MDQDEFSQLEDLADIEIGRREKRPTCISCSRPLGVCWCRNLNGIEVSTLCKIVVLQHPHEEKRSLRTSPILQALIPNKNYVEMKGKKFNLSKYPKLKEILESRNNLLMYPGENATNLEDLVPVSERQSPYNIIILDGTWQQAKSMFHRNSFLKNMCQVRLTGKHISQYVIRTQPTEDALSTVEVAAIALSTLESDWSIYATLLNPLKIICDFQMKHGAVKHHSKEFLILSGNYKKPMGKRTYKKLKKCAIKNGSDAAPEEGTSLLEEDASWRSGSETGALQNGDESLRRDSGDVLMVNDEMLGGELPVSFGFSSSSELGKTNLETATDGGGFSREDSSPETDFNRVDIAHLRIRDDGSSDRECSAFNGELHNRNVSKSGQGLGRDDDGHSEGENEFPRNCNLSRIDHHYGQDDDHQRLG